jgi:hypothetical protein
MRISRTEVDFVVFVDQITYTKEVIFGHSCKGGPETHTFAMKGTGLIRHPLAVVVLALCK